MKKLVTLLTALTLTFTSAALAETAFKTDEAGHPVFENFGEAKQYARAGLIESDYYMIIVPEDHTFYRIRTDYDEKAKTVTARGITYRLEIHDNRIIISSDTGSVTLYRTN